MQQDNSTSAVYTATSGYAEEVSARANGRRTQNSMTMLDRSQKRIKAGKENQDAAALDKMRLLTSSSHPVASNGGSIPHQRQTFSNCGPTHTSSHAALPSPPAFVDIDSSDGDDPMTCSEYADEIFANLRNSEIMRRPSTTYMESIQTDVNPAMRAILVDWLVEVGQEYRLASDTLFLSVAYIDRFLSMVDVRRNKLQLVGVTSMLIASKYEEIYAPQVDEFCYITDNTYPRESVLAMERQVLGVLDFDLTQPTTKTFLRRFIKAAAGELDVNVTFEFLCSYLAELTLMEYSLLSYLPSHVAASCVLVALHYLGKAHWSDTLLHYTGYAPSDLRHCVQTVHGLFLGARTSALPASRDKYANPKFGNVSSLGVPESLPESLFRAW